MDKEQYLEEAQQQLSAPLLYRKMKEDPTIRFKEEVDEFLLEAYESSIISLEEK